MASIRPLSQALARKAAAELNEVPSEIEIHIKELREWLKIQVHLRTPLSMLFMYICKCLKLILEYFF